MRTKLICFGTALVGALAGAGPAEAASPVLGIFDKCTELAPLYKALPANETFVTCLVVRPGDDLVIGAACGKKMIGLFSYNHKTGAVKKLDVMDALWWDDPVLALGPAGDFYLGAKRVYDKQFVFERNRERADTPDAVYHRRFQPPPDDEINEDALGMPIRHYGADGQLLGEHQLPKSLAKDGVGALAVGAGGKMLVGLSSPGGHLFTINLEKNEAKDLGEVVRFPCHHHTRRIDRVLMSGGDGKIYFTGLSPVPDPRGMDDDGVLGRLSTFDPATGEINVFMEPRSGALLKQYADTAAEAQKLQYQINDEKKKCADAKQGKNAEQSKALEQQSDEKIKEIQESQNPLNAKMTEVDKGLQAMAERALLPSIVGRHRFAAVEAAVRLPDGTYVGGTTDGYLFRFDPQSKSLTGYGKPLRQQHIWGLGLGPDKLVYGMGGDPDGLPRMFAFDPATGAMNLGTCPSGGSGEGASFGQVRAGVTTSDGTLIVGEHERRGYLLIYRPPGAAKPAAK